MATGAGPQKLPKYAEPPVIEVVCGVLFTSIHGLLAPHFGLLWEKLRPEYLECQEVAPLVPLIERFDELPEVGLELSDRPPLPRIWFLRTDGSIVQVQRDRFLYNWRKIQPEVDYPHYPEVIERFETYLSTFRAFLNEHNLGAVEPLQYEMTYVNHIPQGPAWASMSEIGKVFPDFSWQSKSPSGHTARFLSAPERIDWRTSFLLSDTTSRLHVHMQMGQLPQTGLPVLRLELTVRGIGATQSLDTMHQWFDFAHETIVRAFADLTSEQAQKDVWKLREE
jgi:uncharacterized protein (TIGR04255 family)